MITLRPIRIDTTAPRSNLIDQALATALARTTEQIAAARPSPLDASASTPVITTIRLK